MAFGSWFDVASPPPEYATQEERDYWNMLHPNPGEEYAGALEAIQHTAGQNWGFNDYAGQLGSTITSPQGLAMIAAFLGASALGAGAAGTGAGVGAGETAGATGAGTVAGGATSGGALSAASTLPEIVAYGTPGLTGAQIGALGAVGASAAIPEVTAYGNPNTGGFDSSIGYMGSVPSNLGNLQTLGGSGEQPGALEQAGDYLKDPKNWGTVQRVGGALGALTAGSAGSSPAGPASSPGGYQHDVPLSPLPKFKDPGDLDYFHYGEKGGEHQFYQPESDANPQLAGLGQKYGFSTGHLVRGPGTGRSDEIPAQLSDGEYVMDAETVALLGDGSTDEGARRLDEMRQRLRKHKGQELSKGKFSANAKRPEQYIGDKR